MLERLVAAFQKRAPGAGGKGGMWAIIVAVLILLVGGVIAYWILRRDGRELARLRHEKYARQIVADSAKVEAALRTERAAAQAARAQANAAAAAVEQVDEQLAAARERYSQNEQTIARLRWGDLRRAPAGG